MKLYKKGGLPDMIYYVVFIFAFAIVIILAWIFQSNFNTNFQASNELTDQSKALMQSSTDRFVNIFDSIFLMVFIGLFAAIGIGVWFIYTHPALYWLSFPLIAIIVFIAIFFGNLFHSIANQSSFISYFNNFTIISFVFNNWIKIIVVFVVFFAVLLFSKSPNDEELRQ